MKTAREWFAWFEARNGYLPSKLWIEEDLWGIFVSEAIRNRVGMAPGAPVPSVLMLGGVPTFPR